MRAWEQFLTTLDPELGKASLDKWARSLKVASFDARNLYLEAYDPFQIHWFEEHIRPHLKGFTTSSGHAIRVHLGNATAKGTRPKETSFAIVIEPSSLDPDFTLANFISDDPVIYPLFCNLTGFKAQPNSSLIPGVFNPIFLYGEKGSGKSHLLMASARALQEQGKKPFYVRADTFADHVVQAIRSNKMADFRSIYRNIDVLLIDDVEELARKTATQEEFFHTFNTLHTAGKQIILSAPFPPSKLVDIEPRLISRFEWGISLELKKIAPLSILEMKAPDLSKELLLFLAEAFPRDPAAALQALRLRSEGNSLSIEEAKKLLQGMMMKEKQLQITPEAIIAATAAHYGVKSEDLLGKSHMREYAFPRQIAIYLCRTKLRLPFQAIGRVFQRDHSTIMSSVREITNKIEKDPAMAGSLHEISLKF